MSSSAVIAGLGVKLRPIEADDYPWLFALETSPEIIQRYRLGGMTPPFEAFPKVIDSGVFEQYVVVETRHDTRIGHLHLYNVDVPNQTAYVGWLAHPEADTGALGRALVLFIASLLIRFDFRKLYGEAVAFNLDEALPRRSPQGPRPYRGPPAPRDVSRWSVLGPIHHRGLP